ncbi:ATPase subunit of ABC transporter with duplicated ATPase domains [Neobacillus drentensis]|nr:ATPase subunit of ABC transporter with duplicated ATPase domains [Neobacillus drentensis]
MSLLNIENLSHTFGDRTLFKDVSFRLLAEDHVGLVGANGVGKSTLMNIITGQFSIGILEVDLLHRKL